MFSEKTEKIISFISFKISDPNNLIMMKKSNEKIGSTIKIVDFLFLLLRKKKLFAKQNKYASKKKTIIYIMLSMFWDVFLSFIK